MQTKPDLDRDDANPWYVRLLERVLSKEGAATAIGMYLVWFLAGDVRGEVRMIRTEHQELLVVLRELAHYSFQECINSAQTDAQRASCVYRESRR
jgi:hypothetical protein